MSPERDYPFCYELEDRVAKGDYLFYLQSFEQGLITPELLIRVLKTSASCNFNDIFYHAYGKAQDLTAGVIDTLFLCSVPDRNAKGSPDWEIFEFLYKDSRLTSEGITAVVPQIFARGDDTLLERLYQDPRNDQEFFETFLVSATKTNGWFWIPRLLEEHRFDDRTLSQAFAAAPSSERDYIKSLLEQGGKRSVMNELSSDELQRLAVHAFETDDQVSFETYFANLKLDDTGLNIISSRVLSRRVENEMVEMVLFDPRIERAADAGHTRIGNQDRNGDEHPRYRERILDLVQRERKWLASSNSN